MSAASPHPIAIRWDRMSPLGLVAALIALHAVLVWWSLGSWAGLQSEWPILLTDHGFNYSQALVGRAFVRESGWAAGYDPSFMAGYPASIFTATSAPLATLLLTVSGGLPPALVYKAAMGLAVFLPLGLVAWAGALLGLDRRGVAWATIFYFLYFWTDFPKGYASTGMTGFLLMIPMGLVGLGLLVRFLERGGSRRWLGAALGLGATFFLNITSPLVVAGAGLAAYLSAVRDARRSGGAAETRGLPWARHLGFWALAPAVLALNASWLLPGYWLRATLGDTRVMFVHTESVVGRLGRIFWEQPPIQSTLLPIGLFGLIFLRAARPVAAGTLGTLVALGLVWGYLAGWVRLVDPLQPGRQTYALYAGLCVAGGYGLEELGRWLRDVRPGRWDRWLALALVISSLRMTGPLLLDRIQTAALSASPFLASRPHPALPWLIEVLRQHVQPGERLLFEESGLEIPGLTDPFLGQHFSPVLPERTGVEVLGGPFLHCQVQTNFTQFGEEKLFGLPDWGVDQFVRYARLYRPAAIACWTPKARSFCHEHPELIRVIIDGPYTVGRVLGFEGFTSRGQAEVTASPNRLVVRNLKADPADGRVVLRYHWVPGLVADPPLTIEPMQLEADPVPFIALRPTGGAEAGPWTIRLALPPLLAP